MKALFFIRQIFKKFYFLLITNVFLLLLVGLVEGATVFSLVVVVDLFLNPGLKGASPITQNIIAALEFIGMPTTLGWILALVLFFTVLRTCFQISSYCINLKIKYAVLRDIMLGTFEDFFNARWYFFSSGEQGTLLNTFLREIDIIGDAFAAMADYFSSILQVVLFLAVPFYISWQVTSVVIITGFLLAAPFLLLGRIGYRLGGLNTSTANKMSKVIQESLSSAKIILGFGNPAKNVEALRHSYDAHRNAALRSFVFKGFIALAYNPCTLLVLIIGLFVSKKIALPLSETLVLFYSLARILPLIGKIAGSKSALDNLFPSYEQVLSLSRRARELKQPSGNKKFIGFNREIVVEALSFAFPNHGPVLNNINMIIPKGNMIAVVGKSGVGKSTFIDMLMRFHDPASGGIFIDGVCLKDFDVKSYRQRIGYVPQDTVLFNMSIRDNLLWGNETADDDQIKNACLQANAEEFIKCLPRGYNTPVGDRGVCLSGGQAQRVALARAILRHPDLLILDEATSALDTYSERLIQQAIENISGETTVIVIAHRLSTIKNADYIYVLSNGAVTEEGRYSELIQKDGHFSKMAKLQMLETEEARV